MTIPEFRDTSFLLAHAEVCLDFFSRAECVRSEEKGGGLYHCYRDDGSVYDTEIRHLVSSTRYVVQWAWALQRLPRKADKWRHFLDLSLQSLRRNHFEESTGRYVWQLSPLDATNYCYGMAFALLAYSTAYRFGACEEALGYIERTWDVMTAELWEEDRGLYKDSMESAQSYRGQNCVMHCLEAHLAAYEATRDEKHLLRARRIAKAMCIDVISGQGGLVYEHYTADWKIDVKFNEDKRDDVFRPWGYQPGHLLEWAKLLLQLDRHGEEPWRKPLAAKFFEVSMTKGWDDAQGGGGFVYSMDFELNIANTDKYKWVQAEGIATAALLAEALPERAEYYWSMYDKIWAYSWQYLVDHCHGSWYRLVSRDGTTHYDDLKCPPGKVDYHVTGMCYDVVDVIRRLQSGK